MLNCAKRYSCKGHAKCGRFKTWLCWSEAYYSVNVLSYSVDALFLFVSQNWVVVVWEKALWVCGCMCVCMYASHNVHTCTLHGVSLLHSVLSVFNVWHYIADKTSFWSHYDGWGLSSCDWFVKSSFIVDHSTSFLNFTLKLSKAINNACRHF